MTLLKKQLLLPCLLFAACLYMPCRTQAQLISGFSVAPYGGNACFVNVSWAAADFSINQRYVFITRSNDNASTFNVIATVAIPSNDLGNGNTWNGTYADTDPYGSSTSLYTNGATQLFYRVYFVKDDGSLTYSPVASINSVPAQRGSCSGLGNPCAGNSTSITGPASTQLNTATFYSVTSSTQVRWTISNSSPANIATVSAGPNPFNPTNWQATVNFTQPGAILLTANFPDCGSSVSLPICTAAPDYNNLSVVSQGPSVCPNVPVAFGARYNSSCTNLVAAGITNIQWSVSPAAAQIVSNAGTAGCGPGITNSGVTIRFNPNPTQYNVRITAQNACGTSSLSNGYVVTFMSGCASLATASGEKTGVTTEDAPAAPALPAFTMSPNPSTGLVSVASPASAPIRQIDVYNLLGMPVKSLHYSAGTNGTVTIDLSNAPKGVYIMTVLTSTGRYNKKLALLK